MFSTAEKTHHPAPLAQQKAQGSTFFRKAGADTFFGQGENKAFFSPPVQAQLEVSHPDDPQEKEADSVAAAVSRMAEPAENEKKEEVHRAVDERDGEKEKDKVHRKSFGVISRLGNNGGFTDQAVSGEEGAPVEVHAKLNRAVHRQYLMRKVRGPPEGESSSQAQTFEQSLSSSKGEGRSLPDDTRQSMESRFGADFSGVRIHTGTGAETLSRNINAQAFTHGSDIYFNAGKFSPNTSGGSVLLAHELTHTIQQGASPVKTGSVAAKSIQRKSVNRKLQRLEAGAQRNAAVELAKAEQGKVSAKKPGPDGHRVGWQRLLEYFKTTFGADKILPEGASVQPGTVNESDIKTYREFKGDVMVNEGTTVAHDRMRDAMPSWCGIFAFWALNKGGIPLKKWTLGTSMIPPESAYPPGYQPQPGDIAYRKEFSHYALVASADGSNVTSINGNTAGEDNVGGEIQMLTHPMEHWAAFFNPTLIMEGSLRDPGSPDNAGAAPQKSLKELRKELFNVQTKAEGQTATVNTAAAVAPARAPAPTSEKSEKEKPEDKEREEVKTVSSQFEIGRSMDGGKYHEAQRAIAHPSADPSSAAPVAAQELGASGKSVTREAHHSLEFPNRGPPRAPPAIQAVVHRKLIQRSWLGDAWDAVSGFVSEAADWVAKGLDAAKTWLLNKVRDFVRNIPGYKMLCLVLGHDPITGEATPLTGATLLDAGLDLLPLGFMFRQLMQRLNIFNDVAQWLQGRIDQLSTLVSGIGARFDRFWDSLTLDRIGDPQSVMNDVADLFRSIVEGIVSFVTNAVSDFLEMIKRVMIREVSAFVRAQIPHLFPLLTVALGFNPETMEPVARNGTNILNAFLEVSEAGREQRTQMQDTGTFQRIAGWIDRGIAVFSRAYTLLTAAFRGIWSHVNIESLFHPIQTFTDIWNTFAEPVGIVGQFLLDAAIEILKVIKDVLLRRLSAYARQTRGYGLVCVLIGRDPFTGEVVERTVHNIVKGFFSLLDGGEAQYEELKKSGAIDRIIAKVEAAVDELNMTPRAILQLFIDLWNSFSIHDLVHPIDCFIRIVSKFGEPILRLIRFVIKIIMIVIEAILILMNFPFDLIGQIIDKAKQAWELIKRDPAAFFKNLLAAIKQGFIQFFDNILTHLWNGLKQWFLGEVQDAGIPIPTDFSVLGIIKWLLVVLDITMEKIWKKLEDRIGKEKVDKIKRMVAMAERVVGAATEAIQFIQDVRERGFLTVIGEKIMEQLTNAWDLVLDALKGWVMDQIIKKVTAKLLSMLDPTGIMAVVNSAIALYKAVQSFIKYLRRMLEIVNSFVGGILEIAQGSIANAANFLEGALAKGIPIAIGFLANQVGLNLSERLREALEVVREKVDNGLTWVIDKLVTVVERLIAMGRGAVAAVKRWLGLEKRFDASDGTSHRLYMAGNEDSPVLMVQSNPQAYSMFLATVTVSDTDPKKAEKDAAKAQAVTIAAQIDDRKSKTLPGESKEDKIAAVQLLLDQLAPYTAKLFGDPSQAGEPDVQFPGQQGTFGKTMTAVRLNKNQKLKGTRPTSAANDPYDKILDNRRDTGNPAVSYYVKGHLLNDNLGGVGNWNNLTPLSRTGNSNHEGQVESLVKAAFNSGATVEYKVTAIYGWGGNASVIPATDADAVAKKAIIEEEKNVPLRLHCEANTLEKSGDQFVKKDSIVTTDVENTLGQTAESYVVAGTKPTRSFTELETEAKAMISSPPPDTWSQFQNKDRIHRDSIAAMSPVEKGNLERLFVHYFRGAEKDAELSRIQSMGAHTDIQTWAAFKGGRTFYNITDASSTQVENAFKTKQSLLRNQAFDSAQAATSAIPPGTLWRDFKIANHINFAIEEGSADQTRLDAVQTAFNAASQKTTT